MRLLGPLLPTRSDPPDALSGAGSTMERPRVVVVNDAKQAAITKQGPAPGMFVVNYQKGELSQWVGDHWEIVAAHVIGTPPYKSGGRERDLIAFRNSMFGAMGSRSGGVVPAPRRPPDSIYPGFPGDPSVTEPLAGFTYTVNPGIGTYPFAGVVINSGDPPEPIINSTQLFIPAAPTAPDVEISFVWNLYFAFSAPLSVGPGQDLLAEFLLNGVGPSFQLLVDGVWEVSQPNNVGREGPGGVGFWVEGDPFVVSLSMTGGGSTAVPEGVLVVQYFSTVLA